VKSRKQAIAIALSKARKKGRNSPKSAEPFLAMEVPRKTWDLLTRREASSERKISSRLVVLDTASILFATLRLCERAWSRCRKSRAGPGEVSTVH